MNSFYYCEVCEEVLSKEELIEITGAVRWKECPVCQSKVFQVTSDNFDDLEVRDLIKAQLHRALS